MKTTVIASITVISMFMCQTSSVKKYGISKNDSKYNYIEPVCFDEQLVDVAAE